jgi:hypothetical protein
MARNPPPNEFGSDGRLARLEAVSHLWLPKPLAWPFPEPELEDTLARARDFAISEFLKFLASSCPQRLFKCDGRRGCGAYFVRTRAPRKETLIYHGTFCENCKNAGEDKKRRTEEIRSNLAESLWKLAAHHWPNWNPKIHGQSRSKWVAEMMNEKLVKKGICKTGKWVTQNRVMIEAEVERKNHAKG